MGGGHHTPPSSSVQLQGSDQFQTIYARHVFSAGVAVHTRHCDPEASGVAVSRRPRDPQDSGLLVPGQQLVYSVSDLSYQLFPWYWEPLTQPDLALRPL